MRKVALSIDWDLPLFCLDIDGVLAPYDDSKSTNWDDWVEGTSAGFVMAFSAKMIARLTALRASRVWLTTWEEKANQYLLGQLGWAPLPTLRSELRSGDETYEGCVSAVPDLSRTAGGRWWKIAALHRLLRYVEADPDGVGVHLPPALVWADDDLVSTWGARAWAERLPFPTLILSPNRSLGLSSDEVARIEAFFSGLARLAGSPGEGPFK